MRQFVRKLIPDSLAAHLSKAVWQQINATWQLQSGLIVEVNSIAEWVVYNSIFVDGEYDIAIDLLLGSDDDSPLILDLGANVGYFCMRFADLWLRRWDDKRSFTVVGVEGSPATYQELLRRTNQPAIAGRCDLHLGLAGERSGVGYISKSPFHVTNSIVTKKSGSATKVPFIDLYSLIPENRQIALLKCDIEGAEESVLENYPDLLKRVDVAIFELHSDKCDTKRCIELLDAAGLSYRKNIRRFAGITVDLFAR